MYCEGNNPSNTLRNWTVITFPIPLYILNNILKTIKKSFLRAFKWYNMLTNSIKIEWLGGMAKWEMSIFYMRDVEKKNYVAS